MDPGNFATNIQAGAKYGYGLLWVVLLANLIAMLFQALSAKLGIVTGRNLAEICRDEFPRPVVLAMWVVSEIAAMATDLAEFLGGSIGLALLFNMPLLSGMAVTGVVVWGVLLFEGRGFRPLELIIGGLVAVIALCYLIEMFIAPVDWRSATLHMVVPQIADGQALMLAVGIIGATVMPHAVYLHSGLTQARIPPRNESEKRRLVRISNHEVIAALAVAGLVNIAMVLMASAAFHSGHAEVAEIETAYHTLIPLFGGAAAAVFPRLASRLRRVQFDGRDARRANDHARLCRLPHPDLDAAARHDAAGLRGRRARCRYNRRRLFISQVVLSITLPLPMVALHVVHKTPRPHGPLRQSLADSSRGRHRRRHRADAQRIADRRDIRHFADRLVFRPNHTIQRNAQDP